MLRQLHEHGLTLRKIQSVERKIEAKRTFVGDYDDYITGALEGGQGGQDMVLTTMMVWHLDVGSWARALEIAAYALRHNLALPDRYERDLATLLIDETATAANAGKLVGDEALRARLWQRIVSGDRPNRF